MESKLLMKEEKKRIRDKGNRKLKCLLLILEFEAITIAKLATLLKVSTRTIYTYLAELQKENYVYHLSNGQVILIIRGKDYLKDYYYKLLVQSEEILKTLKVLRTKLILIPKMEKQQ